MLGEYIRKKAKDKHTKSHQYKQAFRSHKGYWYFPETVIKRMCAEIEYIFLECEEEGKRKG